MYEKSMFGQSPFDNTTPSGDRSGVSLAKIVDIKDPKNLGRVKCEFLTGDKDVSKTEWAYVVTPFGGNKHGFFFHPNVGDVVLLAFEGGDIHSPYVIGSLWWKNKNIQNEPPVALTGDNEKNNQYQITTPKGNSIKLSDADKKELIEVKTKGGNVLKIDDGAGKIELKSSDGKAALIMDTKQNAININCTKIEIAAGANKITMDSSGLKIDCKPTTSIKSTTVNIEATGTTDVKGAVINVKSNGITTVKGSMLKLN